MIKKSGRGHVFRDQSVLNEMLSLREQGIGPSALARRYGVDHSVIIYHAKNHGITTKIDRKMDMPVIKRIIIVKQVVEQVQDLSYKDDAGESINAGCDYKEYLIQCEERRWKELLTGGKFKKKQ